jgi:hypothetical protein
MNEEPFKVGDPVIAYYRFFCDDLGQSGYQENQVYFIKAMDVNMCQLAHESQPNSHFHYKDISDLKHSKFTERAHPDMWKYREQAIFMAQKSQKKE